MSAVGVLTNKPAWIDLSSSDAAASRDFYARLFGWRIEVNPDPQYGGYAIASLGDQQAAGIGPKMSPDAPTAWSLYVGTTDADALAGKAAAAGGVVAMQPFDVGDQGRMTVLQDPSGAFISAWQASRMRAFVSGAPNTLGWAELNARGLQKALDFYRSVFGWTTKTSPFGDGQEYTEFQVDGESIAGALEMSPMVPAEVPSYWLAYFNVADVDATFGTALELGAREMVPPGEYPGGRFAILGDPQGATFGLLKSA